MDTSDSYTIVHDHISASILLYALPLDNLSFCEGQILCEKLFMGNTDGCTRMVRLNSFNFFAFGIGRTDFYSLAKRISWEKLNVSKVEKGIVHLH